MYSVQKLLLKNFTALVLLQMYLSGTTPRRADVALRRTSHPLEQREKMHRRLCFPSQDPTFCCLHDGNSHSSCSPARNFPVTKHRRCSKLLPYAFHCRVILVSYRSDSHMNRVGSLSTRPRTRNKRERESASFQKNKVVQPEVLYFPEQRDSSCPRSRQSRRYYLISPVPCSILLYKSFLGGCSHSHTRCLESAKVLPAASFSPTAASAYLCRNNTRTRYFNGSFSTTEATLDSRLLLFDAVYHSFKVNV